MTKTKLFSSLEITINLLESTTITIERKKVLQELIGYINQTFLTRDIVKLVFICTHNSRRSQLAQVWAKTAAYFYNLDIDCYSGGTESTAFNERAVAALKRSGFRIDSEGKNNPVYRVFYSDDAQPVLGWSKIYNDNTNPSEKFAAVMTCSDADQNCPFIPGAEARIPLKYDDPKEFDGTALETSKYDERSQQIAAEMFYVFSKIKS